MRLIRDNTYFRRLFRPLMDAKRKRAHERYMRSPDSWYMKTLKGIYAGKRCFIIGNGPSLSSEDLDKLKDEYTFAANRIYDIFDQTDWRPTFYLAVDDSFLKENLDKLDSYELGHMFMPINEKQASGHPINKLTRIYFGDNYFNVYDKAWNKQSSYVSVDVSDHFSDGFTVTFESIQLAIYMGFTEIYLLGVDFHYSVTYDADGKMHVDPNVQDYFSGKSYPASLQNYLSNLHAYTMAREYCDNHNIVIKNATRGGKLEVFDRTSLEEIIGGGIQIS